MSKFLLHLAVAAVTFTFSTHFTKTWNSFLKRRFAVEAAQSLPRPEAPSGLIAESELRNIYSSYAEAQTKHDRAFFERVEAKEFKLFTEGRAYSRSEDIDFMNSDDDVYSIEDLQIRGYGNAAVVSGRMVATDSRGGVASWNWIDVCVRDDHGWQILSTTQSY